MLLPAAVVVVGVASECRLVYPRPARVVDLGRFERFGVPGELRAGSGGMGWGRMEGVEDGMALDIGCRGESLGVPFKMRSGGFEGGEYGVGHGIG